MGESKDSGYMEDSNTTEVKHNNEEKKFSD